MNSSRGTGLRARNPLEGIDFPLNRPRSSNWLKLGCNFSRMCLRRGGQGYRIKPHYVNPYSFSLNPRWHRCIGPRGFHGLLKLSSSRPLSQLVGYRHIHALRENHRRSRASSYQPPFSSAPSCLPTLIHRYPGKYIGGDLTRNSRPSRWQKGFNA